MGKYEKNRRPASSSPRKRQSDTPSRASRPSAAQNRKTKKTRRLPLVLGLVAAVLVVACCTFAYLNLRDDGRIAQNVYVAGVNLGGMTREEARLALRDVTFDGNMNIGLYTRGGDFPLYTTSFDPSSEQPVDIFGNSPETSRSTGGEEPAEPTEELPDTTDVLIDEDGVLFRLDQTLTLPAQDTNVSLNAETAVDEAYRYGRSLFGSDRVDVDVSKHLTLNEDYIREVLARYLEETADEGTQTQVVESTTTDGSDTVPCLNITLGTVARGIDLDALYERIIGAYMRGEYELQYIYEEIVPEPLDLDALYRAHCTAPVNAVCDEDTYEITDGREGYGFRMADAVAALDAAEPGDTVTLKLETLEPEYTRETLESRLFCDVLASYDSPHSWNPPRTNNLDLACKAIDGTIIKPGEEFSFNKIVGERTAEKGYQAAGVYVAGRTENQLGGGVCQVASTIYLCTLKAELEVLERYEHQFVPDYVPWGMDATIYWGSLDYRFRNTTAYPIRIDASVSGGYVHIAFVGTETRDYTVKLDFEIMGSESYEVVYVDIYPGMKNYEKYKDYKDGEVIQWGYNSESVKTYRYRYDKDGTLLDKEVVNHSSYDLRNQEVARLKKDEPTEAPTEAPTDEPTEASTEAPTEGSTETPTEEPTEPSSEGASEAQTESSAAP